MSELDKKTRRTLDRFFSGAIPKGGTRIEYHTGYCPETFVFEREVTKREMVHLRKYLRNKYHPWHGELIVRRNP